MGCEGIEPLVIRPTCLPTTALQAGVENTTRSNRSSPPVRVALLTTFSVLLLYFSLREKLAQVGVEPTASPVLNQGGLPVAYRADVKHATKSVESSE